MATTPGKSILAGQQGRARLLEILQSPNPDLRVRPNDVIPGAQPEPNINKDSLLEYLLKITKADIADRDGYGFGDRRNYDLRAYYEIKNDFFSNWPWPNASNFPVPLTPAFVDFGATEVPNNLFPDKRRMVPVSGVGDEDEPYAPFVSRVMDWQNSAEAKAHRVQMTNAFLVALRGTNFVKTWADAGDDFRIKHASVPLELVYKSVRGRGCQRDDCDHINQLIPLTENDWLFRKGLRINSKPVYEHLDLLAPGFGLAESISAEEFRLIESQVSGFDLETADARDRRYMMETSLTWYPPKSMRAVELVVWWSLRHAVIHRVVKNDLLVRNLQDYFMFENPGFAFGRSVPEKVRHIQEKTNYTDKQLTDARDIVINPPTYVDEGSGFDPETHVRFPTGMYEVAKGTKIEVEQRNIGPIIEAKGERDALWRLAEETTGFSAILRGSEGFGGAKTLGEKKIILAKSQSKFKRVLDTYASGWQGTCEIQYRLNDAHMPRKKIVKILGAADYQSTRQIFRQQEGFGFGFEASFDFSIAVKTQDEVALEEAEHAAFLLDVIKVYGPTDDGALWKAMRDRSRLIGLKNFERIKRRPLSADVMGVEEVLQRIESGEIGVLPNPLLPVVEIEADIYKIGAFARTERFENYSEEQRAELRNYLQGLEAMRWSKKLAQKEREAMGDPAKAVALQDFMQMVANGEIAGPGRSALLDAQEGGGIVPS